MRVRDFLTTHGRISAGRVVHIVTGKGSRSEGAAVLLELVRDMLEDDVVELVANHAGLMGEGEWVVRLG